MLLVLILASGAAAAAEVGAPLAIRLPLALTATLVLPGLALTAACFPRVEDLSGAERGGLAVALSLALVVVTALGLSYTPWGLGFQPMVAGLTTMTVLLSAAGWLRQRSPAEPATVSTADPAAHREATQLEGVGALTRPSPAAAGEGDFRSLTLPSPAAAGEGDFRTSWLALAALAAVFAILGGALLTLGLQPDKPAAQFYMLGSAGLIQDLPLAARAGQPTELTANLDHEPAGAYRVIALHDGAILGQTSATLAAGQLWQPRITLTLTSSGNDQRVDVQLSRSGTAQPYRQLTLWLNVAP